MADTLKSDSIVRDGITELLNTPIPAKLWHYTSIEGFHGIVTSKRIYATDLRYLNDRQEFVHVKTIADQIVQESPEVDATGLRVRFFLEELTKATFEVFFDPNRFQIFVASFSAAEDQLSQWRGYSRGSCGVSVGFDLRAIRPSAESGSLVSFAPCVYKEADQIALVKDAFEPFRGEIEGHWHNAYEQACSAQGHEPPVTERADFVLKYLAEHPQQAHTRESFFSAVTEMRKKLFQLAALLKNRSFREEAEWRLVLPLMLDSAKPVTNPPQFRPGKTSLIPYISHPLASPAPIVDVILGPGSDESSCFAAQKFLKSEGINTTPRLSSVPYRAM